MSWSYLFWNVNNTIYSACTYYVSPLLMKLVDKYGYKAGLTIYNVAKADAMFPVNIYKMIYR